MKRILAAGQTKWRYPLLVLMPAALTWAYLALWAADGYVSYAEVMVEQESQLSSSEIPLLSLISMTGGTSKLDVLLVESFMQSRTMLEFLDEELQLREHLSSSSVDVFSRLPSNASHETFLEYYRDHLKLVVHDESMILSVAFVAFEPEYAQRVTRALISRAEDFVNEVSNQLARGQLAFIEKEVERANKRLKEASSKMVAIQRQNDLFSAEQQSISVGEILAGLDAELVKQRTQLKALSGYLNPQAPDVVAARQRVQALEKQTQQERQRLVGAGEKGLNVLMLEYKEAEVNVKLALEMYASALAAMETTRLDAVRKVKYLVSVDAPSLPESAEHPRVMYWFLTTLVFLNLAYFVLSLSIAAIQDHRE